MIEVTNPRQFPYTVACHFETGLPEYESDQGMRGGVILRYLGPEEVPNRVIAVWGAGESELGFHQTVFLNKHDAKAFWGGIEFRTRPVFWVEDGGREVRVWVGDDHTIHVETRELVGQKRTIAGATDSPDVGSKARVV